MSSTIQISSNDVQVCSEVLSHLNSTKLLSSLQSEEFDQIRSLIVDLSCRDRQAKQKKLQQKRLQVKLSDQKAKNQCLLRAGRAQNLHQLQLENVLIPDGPVLPTEKASSSQRLTERTHCYICKLRYRTLHFFYDRLCPGCAQLNYEKRLQTTDLSNRVALVTGGRMKIGYRIVLKLLRAQCFVIGTSRFPMDFLRRLAAEEDFDQWKDRIHVYGVDFRYSFFIEHFCSMLIEKYSRLDFLINNACQTIRRPKEFYEHLIIHERLNNYSSLPIEHQQILHGNLLFFQSICPRPQLSLHSMDEIVRSTEGKFDVHQQPIDLRPINSWTLRLGDLTGSEIDEVLTINTLAPFILNSRLKVLMSDKHPDRESIKFIINVSAMEGSFSRRNKTDRHPHTNAAKAALNMMTQTSADDYRKSNIFMVSVDTGWINDENPLERALKKLQNTDFQTPLDEEDAAARVLDPIISTYGQIAQGKTDLNIPYGCFLKDYQKCHW